MIDLNSVEEEVKLFNSKMEVVLKEAFEKGVATGRETEVRYQRAIQYLLDTINFRTTQDIKIINYRVYEILKGAPYNG